MRAVSRRLLVGLGVAACAAAAACGRDEAPAPVPPPFQGVLVGSRLPALPVHSWVVRPQPPGRDAEVARVILFWNYKDATSLDALAFVDSLAHAHSPKRLSVTTIHTPLGFEGSENADGLRDFLAARAIALPVGIDRENEALHLCRFADVPALVIVGRRSLVRGVVDNYRRSEKPRIAEYVGQVASER